MRVSACARGLAAVAALAAGAGIGGQPASGADADAACHFGHYVLTELPLLPTSINAAGQVAGTIEHQRAAVWSRKAGLEELPIPDGFVYSQAVALNASGKVLIVATDQKRQRHQAFVFAGKAATRLPGEQTRGFALNARGDVAGESLLSGGPVSKPVLWTGTVLHPLPACCSGVANGLNDQGQVIGDIYNDAGQYHAFLWNEQSGIQLIGGEAQRYSSAIAINRLGHVVFQTYPGEYLYADGVATRLVLGPKNRSRPHALNDCDVIVGAHGPNSDAERAFRWDKVHGFIDLNSLIDAAPDWRLQAALGINDRGEIVGKAEHLGDDDIGFLLVPR